MQELGDYSIKNNDFEICHDVGWLMSSELLASGIDISFAPVLDIQGVSEVIGDRSFHQQPQIIVQLASDFIKGMHRAGMSATGKHFPGHGDTSTDSHHALPTVDFSRDRIEEVELYPYKEII